MENQFSDIELLALMRRNKSSGNGNNSANSKMVTITRNAESSTGYICSEWTNDIIDWIKAGTVVTATYNNNIYETTISGSDVVFYRFYPNFDSTNSITLKYITMADGNTPDTESEAHLLKNNKAYITGTSKSDYTKIYDAVAGRSNVLVTDMSDDVTTAVGYPVHYAISNYESVMVAEIISEQDLPEDAITVRLSKLKADGTVTSKDYTLTDEMALMNMLEPLVVNAIENAGNVTVSDFSGAVNRINAVLSEYPNKTISCSLLSETFNNTTIKLELTQHNDTEVHFSGDVLINGNFVFLDLAVNSSDNWTFTSKQYTLV